MTRTPCGAASAAVPVEPLLLELELALLDVLEPVLDVLVLELELDVDPELDALKLDEPELDEEPPIVPPVTPPKVPVLPLDEADEVLDAACVPDVLPAATSPAQPAQATSDTTAEKAQRHGFTR